MGQDINLGLNLLPWRERLEKRRKAHYLLWLGVALGAPCLVALWLNLQAGAALETMREQIADAATDREAIQEMAEAREEATSSVATLHKWLEDHSALRQRRSLLLDVWSELSRHLPDAIYYERIASEGPEIRITGFTASSPELASYLRRLEASATFSSPRLTDLEDHPYGHRFAIEARLGSVAPGN